MTRIKCEVDPFGARRYNSTLSEVLLWNQLKSKKLMGLDFDRQKVINNIYIVDFYCPQYDLIIEVDGFSHDNKREYDRERNNYLTGLGFNVLHIGDLEIKKDVNEVVEYIKQSILTIHKKQTE